ncbi:hypothetical protein TNCV_3293511 [Trichonephila clavipes]|nr:hypothetical protein TNCV_3293511 [Trichonephila clavipes]
MPIPLGYRGHGLFFREIGQRVGRNQATVMRICHRWMQKETTNRPRPSSIARDGSRSHITTDSAYYASFGVHSYHSTPFAAEWNVHYFVYN